MRNLSLLIASAVTLALCSTSCVVTDVEDASPGGSGGEGGGMSANQGGINEATGGSSRGGSGGQFDDSGGTGGTGGMVENVASSGVVACGGSTCTIPELCCVIDGNPECVSAPDECNSIAATTKVSMLCDDVLDCMDGEACCSSPDAGGEVYACGPSPCDLFEVCVEGGTCVTADQTCTQSMKSASGYECVAD